MPITLVLTAIPATFIPKDGSGEQTLITKPFGKKYGLSMYFVKDFESIMAAVGHFSHQVHSQFPDHSFTVMVRVRSGDTPPSGFDQAVHSGALGQHRFASSIARCWPKQGAANDVLAPSPPTRGSRQQPFRHLWPQPRRCRRHPREHRGTHRPRRQRAD
jgi:hypothetical protein